MFLNLKPGDRVAIEPGYPCRRCEVCLAVHHNLCPEMVFAATPPHDRTLTGYWGTPIKPLAVAVHMARQAEITPGASVVVMGAGPVGLLCAAVSKAFGASKVVGVDIVPSKLELTRTFAATHTYLSHRVPAEDNAKAIIKQCDIGKSADVVVDASGAEPSIQASLHVGGMDKADVAVSIMSLCQKEVTAKGSFRYGAGGFKLAIELVESGSVDVKKLVTPVVPFG
ncbi:hypothetical protein F4809DRAFT_649639 [Biscogniauxia mediterranea]|nr:hypothetical protein F4809DRAFT_649639 [Biscogniauxia mediterranea]